MKRLSEYVRTVEEQTQEAVGQFKAATSDAVGTIKVTTKEWKEKALELIEQGRLRSVVVRGSDEKVIAKINVLVTAIGVVAAPMLAAVGTLVALLTDCTIELEVEKPAEPEAPPPAGPEALD